MSVIIFFGICAFILIISTTYLTVVFRHYYKQSKVGKSFDNKSRAAEMEAPASNT